MHPVLPHHLIHAIILLSTSCARSEVVSAALDDTTLSTVLSSSTSHAPLMLVDTGVSIRDYWSDLREASICPAPSDVVRSHSARAEDEQRTLETVPSTAHFAEPSSAISNPARTEDNEEQERLEIARIEDKDDFVSFEDWKRMKLAEEEREDLDDGPNGGPTIIKGGAVDEAESSKNLSQSPRESFETDGARDNQPEQVPLRAQASDRQNITLKEPALSTQSSSNDTAAVETRSPRQPSPSPPLVHNRYNYASPDCSARIHSSSPQTQHASSLLHKSRDRYMLTPCKTDEHWVIIELCDEIRIEAVEIAVWEFFSGVVREVRVSVGGEIEIEDETEDEVKVWEEVGFFVGKNVRGVQTFTLSGPTAFHRFLRLDFPSYYGTEYYCPVSQVKVFGMNQMEAFKWEQKRLAATAKEREKDKGVIKDREAAERRAKDKEEKERLETAQRREEAKRESELGELERMVQQQAGRIDVNLSDLFTEASILSSASKLESTVVSDLDVPSTSSADANPSTVSGSSSATKDALDMSSSWDSRAAVTENNASDIYSIVSGKTAQTSSASTTSTSVSSSTYARAPPPRSDSSESIYAFIIRRLTALEGNSSLVARYIEEQGRATRLMLGRLEKGWDDWRSDREGEDRARWEQERMRQEDRFGRVISSMEQQRVTVEQDRQAMQAQLRVLIDEIGYERRRGLAQLFIMLILIILGVATRSSTIDAILQPLVAEARRRKGVYGRRSIYGPLAGLRIDLGDDRPPAVIGQERPQPLRTANSDPPASAVRDPLSSLPPKPHVRTSSRGNSLVRRAGTPSHSRHRRHPSLMIPTYRSLSVSETNINQPDKVSLPIASNMYSYRPRASLPPSRPNNGAPRKLARSAHLHTFEGDRSKAGVKQDDESGRERISPDTAHDEEGLTPRPHRVSLGGSLVASAFLSTPSRMNGVSPLSAEEGLLPDQPVFDLVEEYGDWGTDHDGAGASSVSEVEDGIHVVQRARKGEGRATKAVEGKTVDPDLVQELAAIWTADEKIDTQHSLDP